MRELAQTNLQLYGQLTSFAWAPSDLATTKCAYELACRLFSARYRASGKTFVSHLVGTASAVAETGARPPVVAAALLHAAYEQGDFGIDQDRAARRTRLVDAVGVEIEGLIATYTAVPWNPTSIRELLGEGAALSQHMREVVLIRIANEIDERVDGGVDVADRGGYELYSAEVVQDLSQLATVLGYEILADVMRRIDAGSFAVVAEVRSPLTRSVLRPPMSFRRRRSIRSVSRSIARRVEQFRRL